MNIQTVAIASTAVVATVMVTKKFRTRRINKRLDAEFAETVRTVEAMLQNIDVPFTMPTTR